MIEKKSNPKSLKEIGTSGWMINPVIISNRNIDLLLKVKKYRNI